MSHRKDTDYLALSARLRAQENDLLTRERLERMIDAKELGDAVKVLTQCGYPEPESLTQSGLEAMLARKREETFADLAGSVPDPRLVQIFQLKYDYHNAKALIKGAARGEDVARLLVRGGRYDPEQLAGYFTRGEEGDMSPLFAGAMARARQLLADTGDPQLADLELDRACYAELAQLARESGSPFLMGYTALMTDAANLRTAVRVMRMGREGDFLAQALLPGGTVEPQTILDARGGGLAGAYRGTALEQAAQLAAKAVGPERGPLTAFEKACDDALTAYLDGAKSVPFGEEVAVAYLHARESELTAARTVLSGRLAGLDGEVIRSRLRDTYV